MTLVKWKPARNLVTFPGLDDFDSLFSDFFSRPFGLQRNADLDWSPNVDVNETDKEYLLHAELPGIDKKEIEVSVNDSVLTLRGERRFEEKKEDTENNYLFRENRYGKFERSFRFSETVLEDKISAKYKDGILTITIPKAEIPEAHKVEIK